MIDETFHDEGTMFKVNEAMLKAGWTLNQVEDIVSTLQNAGILFRERVSEQTKIMVILTFNVDAPEDIQKVLKSLGADKVPGFRGTTRVAIEPLVSDIEDLMDLKVE